MKVKIGLETHVQLNSKTIEWLNSWLDKNKKFPDFVRRTWATSEIMEKERNQLKLTGWLKT